MLSTQSNHAGGAILEVRESNLLFVALFFASLLFFTTSRLVFLFWNWGFFRSQDLSSLLAAFFYGLRFDIWSVAVLGFMPAVFALVFYKYGKRQWLRAAWLGFFVILQLPGMVLTLGDWEFVNYTGRRFTYDALFALREVPGKFWQITLSYWPIFIIGSLMLLAYLTFAFLALRSSRLARATHEFESSSKKKRLIALSFALVALALGLRGGWQKKPLGFAHAQIFTQPMMNNLVLNSSFTFLQTTQRQSLPRVKYFAGFEEMIPLLNGSLPGPSVLEGHRPSKPQNVILIIVESLSLEYMGLKGTEGEGYTPFLDSLAEQGLFFTNHFANARRSIEGVGAILGGIPALMAEPFLSSQYMSNYFLGIGSAFESRGYHTSFFHGGQNGTFYFDSFIKSVGIQNYYGANEYPNAADFDGTWGIYDEPFLQWMVTQLNSFPRPFFSGVFTLSSHNPFRIPEQYKGKFPKGLGEIHESIGYADFALKRFFAEAAKQAWYQDTLFVITGDHTYKSWRKGWASEIGNYKVPLIFFHPQFKFPKSDTKILAQQIDILPSILDFLGSEGKERNYLSRSVFVPGERTVTIYLDQRYHLIGRDFFLTHHLASNHYDFFSRQDEAELRSLSEPAAIKVDYINRLKASIQYFSQGLWDNKIYYPAR